MSYRVQANQFSDKLLTATEAAYLAGIFDGEGSVYLVARKAPNRRSHLFVAEMTVAGSSMALMNWLANTTGNGRIYVSQKPEENHKQVYSWQLAPRQIRHILPQIAPYLQVKAQQAALMLEYFEIQARGARKGDNLPRTRDEDIPRILALYAELRELNRRGLKPVEELGYELRPAKAQKRTCDEPDCESRRYRSEIHCYQHWLQRRERVERACEYCGETMDAILAHKRFCSDRCQTASYYRNVLKPAEAAKLIHTQRCPGCNQNFKTDYASKKYCSRPCYMRHRRAVLFAREHDLPEPTALATHKEPPPDETQGTLDV